MLCLRIIAITAFLAGAALAADAAPTPEQEAEYTRVIEKRSADIVAKLNLPDPSAAARVQATLVAHYRNLRQWHDANGPRLKDLKKQAPESAEIAAIEATLKAIHDDFLAKLAADLPPAKIEQVKDLLTYNVLHVTYDGYCDMLPNLTEAQKGKIKAWLTEAREIAMDQGSSEEKHAVFGKYKGRINNYLSNEGYDLRQATKDWQTRLKARREAQTRPS